MKNDYREMQSNIKMPKGLKERTMEKARNLESHNPQPKEPKRKNNYKRFLVAAAIACIAIIGGSTIIGNKNASPSVEKNNSFGIVAYAAQSGDIIEPKDSRLVFSSGGGEAGEDNGIFSGSLFKITGEDIASFKVELDKGKIYRQKRYVYEDTTELFANGGTPTIDGSDTVMITTDDMETYDADACWVLGNSFEEAYDADALYGFWAEYAVMGSDDSDLRQQWHNALDYFNGATMNIIVTFNDGSAQIKTLNLKTGKLEVDYGENEVMYLTGNIVDQEDAKTPYVYGVYAEIEE